MKQMNFSRGNNPKESLSIGNKYFQVTEKLKESCGDLPFIFIPANDFNPDKYEFFKWHTMGSFILQGYPKTSITISVQTDFDDYSIETNKLDSHSSTMFTLKEWFDHSKWEDFYYKSISFYKQNGIHKRQRS